MLSKNAKEIMKLARKSPGAKVSYSEIKDKMDIDYDSAKSACLQLINAGLAVEKDFSPMPGSRIPWGIVLSENGREPTKYVVNEALMYVVKSILVPIIVSVVTTILTLMIYKALGIEG